ncbi:glycosyltransferase family 2 protein [Candidatus Pelagibacter sp.]|nr:glycosyltransferase family 2 protein [Candidatus Pelagibacter sp.]
MKESKIKKKNTFLKKIFFKLSRSLGYEVMDQGDLSLNDSEGKNSNSSLSQLGVSSLTLPMGKVNITRPVKSLDIILRTCASVKMLTQSKERIFEKEKSEYTLRCLKSIVNSIKFSEKELKKIKIKLTIIDFNSNQEIIDKFKTILNNNFFNYEIKKLEYEKYSAQISSTNEENKPVTVNQKSNMSNIHQSIELSKNCEDLIYFVEDDYIHSKNSILELVLAYEKFTSQLNSEVFLCPTDYPYLYRDVENTNVIIGNQLHWRRINHTLCTFLTSKMMIDRYHKKITQMCKFEHYPFEKPLHDIYKKEFCFSPIPSVAIHCTNINSIYGLSPNVDFKKLWEEAAF